RRSSDLRRDEKLIRQRIKEFSHVCDEIPFPCKVSVKKISQCCNNKDDCSCELFDPEFITSQYRHAAPSEIHQGEHKKHGNKHYPEHCQLIWDIHKLTPLLC